MGNWISARKGHTGVSIDYAHTFTNNLLGYDTQIRAGREFEIRIDLSPNLKARNKDTNTYSEARELADGEIERLTSLQIDDDRILATIRGALEKLPEPPQTWRLTLRLEQDWSFVVEPASGGESLILRVQNT